LTDELFVTATIDLEERRNNILKNLGMHNRIELTRYAIRRGLVEP